MKILALFFAVSLNLAHAKSDLFSRALQNDSSAPDYVLITLIDTHGERTELAVTANLLLGAIHLQFHVPYSEPERAKRIAVEHEKTGFNFSNTKALANLGPAYTRENLKYIESKLAGKNREELIRGFKPEGKLHAIYENAGLYNEAYRDAIAYVLLKHDILPEQGDYVRFLYISPD